MNCSKRRYQMEGTQYLQQLAYVRCWRRKQQFIKHKFPIVAASNEQSMEYKKEAPMLMVHTHYSEIIVDVT